MKTLTTIAILLLASPALAQQNFSLSGSACHAITPSQADRLEWRTTGLKNTSLSNGYWVQCPVLKFGDAETFSVRVNFTNESSQEVDVDCNIREYKNGNKVNGSPGSITIAPNSFSSEMIWSGGFKADTHVNVACLLPAQVSVESVQSLSTSGSGGSGGGGSAAEGLVQACVTSPSAYFSSSATDVTMKNGMQINNYDGRRWDSNDSHLTFKIEDGKWYTIEDKREFYRLDVLREPDSCFEPDADIITTVSATEDVSGDKRVYVEGGYYVVDSECDFSQTSLLTYYSPVYNTLYLVDMTTGEDCRVKETVET